MNHNLICKNEAYAIIGAYKEVHNTLGNGFLEAVYKDAIEIEFGLKKIWYSREREYEISYKNEGIPH